MKTIISVRLLLLVAILGLFTTKMYAQSGEPWTSKDLIEPSALAMTLKDAKAPQPAIFNIGPLADIKGAVNIGSTRDNANLEKLRKALASVPKEKVVVIYCGCCPFRNCPNIRPAFSLLKEMGFKNPKLLNLSQNLKVDWTDYGYPMK